MHRATTFGDVEVGSTATRTATVTNNGTGTATFKSGYPRVSGGGYSISATTCGAALTPGASCTITVTFAPQIVGSPFEYIWIYVNESSDLFFANLRGTGTAAYTYKLSFNASSYDFGDVEVGSTATRTATVTNNGTGTATFKSGYPRVSGGGYSISATTCGAALTPGASCTITVTFAPQIVGSPSEYIWIYVNESSDLFFANLRGTGTAAPVDSDNDGVPDAEDNCPATTNPNQADFDGDKQGDVCDPDDDNDGVADWADPEPLNPDVRGAPVIPDANPAMVDHNWTFVDAPSGYLNPVVIVGPPSYFGADPGVARLRNVSDLGFELRLQEWDYRDGAHVVETIPHAIVRAGRHWLSDGSVWEAGTFDLGGTANWASVKFADTFAQPPYLFLTVQTNNGGQAISVRPRDVTATGFQAALFEQESLMDGHASETIGYLAIYSPNGGGMLDLDGEQVPYLLQSVSADHRWLPVLSQRLKLEEEQSLDSETGHIDETLHVLALGNQFFAQQVTHNGGDTTALRRLPPTAHAPMEWGLIRGVDHNWQTVPFAKVYSDPVIVAKPASNFGGDPGVIRLRGAASDKAELRYQEWNYLDGGHIREDVFYLVSEAGQHTLGGLAVEADWLQTSKLGRAGQWESVVFNHLFMDDPVVLSSVMTYAGGDTVTTRIRGLDIGGFQIAMDEQESKADGHVGETLGWVAIKPGTTTTSDGRALDVFFTSVDHRLTSVPYAGVTPHRYPSVIADIDSTYGADPVFLRYANPTNSQITLKLAEGAVPGHRDRPCVRGYRGVCWRMTGVATA